MRRRFFSLREDNPVKFEEYKVTAPDWAKAGDSLEIEAGAQRYVVCVPQGTLKGEQFTVAVPRLQPSVGDRQAGLPCPARACCTCCSTVWLLLVWACVALNYIVHVLWREVRWNAASLVLAHAIIVLQVASFVQCQRTPPGTVTAEWQREAAAGLEPAETCKRSGLLQPARGHFVCASARLRASQRPSSPRTQPLHRSLVTVHRRLHPAGRTRAKSFSRSTTSASGELRPALALASAHRTPPSAAFYTAAATRLGRTIGFQNRKFFVLFLVYSFGLSVVGGVHAAHELLVGLPGRLPPEVLGLSQERLWRQVLQGSPARGDAATNHPMPLQTMHGVPVLLLQVFVAASGRVSTGQLAYCFAVMATCVLDFVAALLLGMFGGWHVYLVLRNRTSHAPEERQYDVGTVANIRQVMGRDAALWLLPLKGAGPTVDGIHWPLGPSTRRGDGRLICRD